MKLDPNFVLTKQVEEEIHHEMVSFIGNFYRVRELNTASTEKDMLYSILFMMSSLASMQKVRDFSFREIAWLDKRTPKLPKGFASIVISFMENKKVLESSPDPEFIANYCVLEALAAKRMYLVHDKRDSWINKLSILWLWVTMTFLRKHANTMLAGNGKAYEDVLQPTLTLINKMVAFDIDRLQKRIQEGRMSPIVERKHSNDPSET